VLAVLPVLLGALPFALLLGAAAAKKGLSPLDVGLLCGLNFAGSSEFVAIQLWQWPAPVLLIAAMTLLVNSRHVLMGAALMPHLRGWRRGAVWAGLSCMTDEVWALALADAARRPDGAVGVAFYAGLAIALRLAWTTGTVLGATLGNAIGDPVAWGFDMAFTAIFLVLLRGLWRGWRASLPWLVSLLVAVAVHLLLPGAWYVAAGALAGLLAVVLLPLPA
jgi:4-azaleucine resistance transporter AzlC